MLNNNKPYQLILLFLLASLNLLTAQSTRFPGASGFPSGNTTNREQGQVPTEKAFVNYYTIAESDTVSPMVDTSLNGFEIFAPHRSFENGALTLGNLGASAQPIIYRSRRSIFTELGFRQYDIYSLALEQMRFYKLNRAYNDLYFSPQSGQENFLVKAKFSRNFADGVNMAIDYERIKQEGFYRNQATKMTRFGLGLSKRSEKHELYACLIANNFNELHNGGAIENIDSFYTDPVFRDQRGLIDTYTDDAESRHQYFSYSLDNIWYDVVPDIKIKHRIRLEHGYQRFSDATSSSNQDSVLYKSYLTDDRGLRMVNRFVRWTNEAYASFNKKNIDFKLGLIYKYLVNDDSLEKSYFHDLALTAELNIEANRLGQLHTMGQLGAGENIGNYLLYAKLNIEPNPALSFRSFIHLSRYDAFLNQRSLIVTGQQVYNNTFNKLSENILGASLQLEKINLELETKAGILNNAVAFDTDALPYQTGTNTEFLQIKLKHAFRGRNAGLENALIYQSFSENIFRLPSFYSRHNAYIQSRFFKKHMLARMGIQFYNIQYDGTLAFMPVNGAFFPAEGLVAYYPITEFYVLFQVESFRFFLRFDNLVDMFQPEVHYQIVNHPQLDNSFRLGVRWIFYD